MHNTHNFNNGKPRLRVRSAIHSDGNRRVHMRLGRNYCAPSANPRPPTRARRRRAPNQNKVADTNLAFAPKCPTFSPTNPAFPPKSPAFSPQKSGLFPESVVSSSKSAAFPPTNPDFPRKIRRFPYGESSHFEMSQTGGVRIPLP